MKKKYVRLLLVLAAIGLFLYGLTPARAEAATTGTPAPSAAPSPSPAEVKRLLDETVPKLLAEHHVPGATVTVVGGGRELYAAGYGVSDVPAGKPVDPARTAFFMGSDAKLFTAIAVLQQVQSGKLDLNADVNHYLTAFRIRDTYPGHPVTVENLLTHTGGFDDTFMGLAQARPEQVGALGATLAAHQPERVRAPGTAAAYDNYGVALAGYLVEVVSGQLYDRYLSEHVLRPLGMDRTSFAQPHPAPIDAELAHGYRPEGSGQTEAEGLYGPLTPTGAAAVTTASDMSRLLLALLQGGAVDGRRILDPATTARLLERHYGPDPRLPGMAYLLEQRDRNGLRLLVKDGDVPGFHTNVALLPGQGVGLYVSVNGDGEDSTGGWTTQQVLNAFLDRFYPAPPAAAAPPAPVLTSGLDAYTGDYRSTRTSQSTLTRASALTGSLHVTAEGGRLTVSGPLSRDPQVTETHWQQIEPGLFQEVGGSARIAFRTDAAGRVVSLLSDADPTVAYEPLAWYQAPGLHQVVMIVSLAVLVLSLIGWAVAAAVRLLRRRSRPATPAAPSAARLLGWTTALLLTAATGGFAMLTADSNALNETLFLGDSPLLTVVPVLILTALALAVPMTVCTVLAWVKGWWGVLGRVHYTGVTLSALFFLLLAGAYDLANTGALDLIG
ncbi:serine hydrolase domain-containing protein [Kitasatospora sp. NPDC051170]|uniref:serine hydrolase domain-containing protein n=1 Tax=Kitasatospora sp. NPDC051170 TaxID=3364056 RepID=UPI00378DC856